MKPLQSYLFCLNLSLDSERQSNLRLKLKNTRLEHKVKILESKLETKELLEKAQKGMEV